MGINQKRLISHLSMNLRLYIYFKFWSFQNHVQCTENVIFVALNYYVDIISKKARIVKKMHSLKNAT